MASIVDRTRKYIGEVKVEMTKVTWPTREELRESTTVVLIAVFIISVFIYAVDLVVNWGVRAIL